MFVQNILLWIVAFLIQSNTKQKSINIATWNQFYESWLEI